MAFITVTPAQAKHAQDLLALSLDELLNVQVVTASRQEEDLKSAAAIMTVITADQIRRSGADTLYLLLEQVTSFHMTGPHFYPQNVASTLPIPTVCNRVPEKRPFITCSMRTFITPSLWGKPSIRFQFVPED